MRQWRMLTLLFGLCLLLAIVHHDTEMAILLIVPTVWSVNLRLGVQNEFERAIEALEADRPAPKYSIAEWYRMGMEAQREGLAYEVRERKNGNKFLVVGKYEKRPGGKERVLVPHMEITDDEWFDKLSAHVVERPVKAARNDAPAASVYRQ